MLNLYVNVMKCWWLTAFNYINDKKYFIYF